jgi:hypothetical protein
MMRIFALVLLALAASGARSADLPPGASGAALAESMRAARHSDGFELRMTVLVTDAHGVASPPLRLSAVGESSPLRERVLVRVLSTDPAQRRSLAAERDGSGRIRAVGFGEHPGDGVREADPLAGLFGSGVVAWDMLAPWWLWPQQQPARAQRVGGHACTVVRSIAASGGAVGEVDSCLDAGAVLAFRTEIFDSRHALLRTITVDKTLRNGAGNPFARHLTIHSADGSVTAVEIYGGDEHHGVGEGTFGALKMAPAVARPDGR